MYGLVILSLVLMYILYASFRESFGVYANPWAFNLPYSYGVERQQRECRDNCYTAYSYNRNADSLVNCVDTCWLK